MDKKKLIREAVIPDYDFLFNETDKKNRKVNFIGKIMRLNIVPIFLSIFLYILQALPIFVTPVLTAEIIDVVTFAVQNDAVNYEMWKTIIIYGSIIIGLTLFNVPMTMLRFRVVSNTVRRTGSGIKCSVVRKLQSLSLTYHKELQTGKVQAKFLKDTDEVDNFYSLFMHNIIPMSLSVLVWFSISVYRNWIVALFFLLIVPINVVLGLTFRKKIRKRFFDLRVDTENMSTKLHTMLEMLPVTKAHGLEGEELKQVKSSIKEVQGSGIAVDRTIGNFGAWQWVVPACLSAICLLFCSTLAILGKISVGEIVLFQSLFSSLSGYLSNLVSCLPSIGKGAEALRSISEIMNVTEVENNLGKKHVPSIEGNIEFNHVHYTYPRTNVEVVTDFSLKVKKGECIAVVGSSGSGKTTLMNMIIGFLPPTEGELLIDGKSIKDFNLTEYRSHISVVPQSAILFSGTIRENITYGLSHYTEEDFNKVVEMANLNEFVKDLPDGLDTQVGERGEKLSGGQRQRVTIARALIRDPQILILDEATSALDNVSEYHVQKAIASSIQGRTTFIVAHRLSTIRDADRIVVMENGEAVEIGTFDELMDKKGKFYELKKLSDLTSKKAEQELA